MAPKRPLPPTAKPILVRPFTRPLPLAKKTRKMRVMLLETQLDADLVSERSTAVYTSAVTSTIFSGAQVSRVMRNGAT